MCAMNPRLLRPTPTGFNPKTIANLSLWMDASKSSTYTQSSGQITEWRSLAGSNTFVQPTANNRPTLFESSSDVQGATPAAINGRQAFYFDGTNDALLSSANIAGSVYTAFGVARSDDITAGRGFFTRSVSGVPNVADQGPQIFRQEGNAVVLTLGFSTTAQYFASAGTLSSGVAAILHVVQSPSTLQVFLNNVGGTAVAGVQNSSSNAATIGQRALFEATFWRGTVGEILLYDRALSVAEQAKVYEHLRSKWGIA